MYGPFTKNGIVADLWELLINSTNLYFICVNLEDVSNYTIKTSIIHGSEILSSDMGSILRLLGQLKSKGRRFDPNPPILWSEKLFAISMNFKINILSIDTYLLFILYVENKIFEDQIIEPLSKKMVLKISNCPSS